MSYGSNWFKGCRDLFEECGRTGDYHDYFIFTVLLARVRYNGNLQDLPIGYVMIGLDELGKIVRATRQEVRSSLKRLTAKQLIFHQLATRKGTILSIRDPSFYSRISTTKPPHINLVPTTNIDKIRKDKITKENRENPPSPISGETTSIEDFPFPEVITHLNDLTGERFQFCGSTRNLMNNLSKKGYTSQDLRDVVSFNVKRWGNDEKMKEHLNPWTLFGPKNFEKYISMFKAKVPVEEKYAELFPNGGEV